MKTICEQIQKMDDFQLTEIIHAVIKRSQELHPDQLTYFLMLSKDDATREEELGRMFQCLKSWSDVL